MSARIDELTATGDVTTTDSYLHAVTCTANGAIDRSSVVVRAGGSGGTIVLTLSANAGDSAAATLPQPALCDGGIHVTLGGSNTAVTVVHE